MNSDIKDLAKRMKINSQALFVNQQDTVYYNEFHFNKKLIREYSFNERGIGLSRNNALMRANGTICIMADDDLVYIENYEDIIETAFANNPKADMIIFNVRIHSNDGTITKVKKPGKVHFLNSLKYGTVSFAFKRESVYKNALSFSLLFGGGAKYSNGEDSLFLWECLRKGLNIYTVEDIIADVYNYESSWFNGYNEKFFFDRGALFAALSKPFSLLLIYQFAIRKHSSYKDEFKFNQSIELMKKGRKAFLYNDSKGGY